MGRGRAYTPTPEVLAREAKVLELRQDGLSFAAIAEHPEVKLHDKSGAYVTYKRALARVHQPAATEIRELQNQRLERLHAAWWPKAIDGDFQAFTAIVRTMERSARLNGLDHEHGIAERALALEADRVRLIAVAFGKALDAANLSAEQREAVTKVFLTELRAQTEDDPDDPPPPSGMREPREPVPSPSSGGAVVDEDGRAVS